MSPAHAEGLNAPLRTRRLTLEPLLGAHAGALFPILHDVATQRWIEAPQAGSVDALEARWGRNECRRSPDGASAWLAWALRRLEDGAYVGKLDAVVDSAGVATNVGYVLGSAHWGRGYATEAVGAVVAHLAAAGVGELRATVVVGNDASARVLEKLGFTRVGVLPAHDTLRGEPHDVWSFVRRAP